MYQLPDTPFGRRVTDQNIIEIVQDHVERLHLTEKQVDSLQLLASDIAATTESLKASFSQYNDTLKLIMRQLQSIDDKMLSHGEIKGYVAEIKEYMGEVKEYLAYGRKVKSVHESFGLWGQFLGGINNIIGLLWKPVVLIFGFAMFISTAVKDSHFLSWLTSWLK